MEGGKDLKVISPAFKNGEAIPNKFASKGENIPPPLIIKEVPNNAKSLAIVMEDPKGPIKRFIHWTVWNIPADINEISFNENFNYPQGKNTMLRRGYLGPCPPFGEHNYFFKVYALDSFIELKEGASIKKLERLISEHIIDKAELMGIYKK